MGRGSSKAGNTGGGGGTNTPKEIVFLNFRGNRSHAPVVDEVGEEATQRSYQGTFDGYDIYKTDNSMQPSAYGYEAVKRGKSVSGNYFDANDWTTWTVGTKLDYLDRDDDIGYMDGKIRRSNRPSKWVDATVKAIGDNYLVVDVPSISDHMYMDADFAEYYRVKKR